MPRRRLVFLFSITTLARNTVPPSDMSSDLRSRQFCRKLLFRSLGKVGHGM